MRNCPKCSLKIIGNISQCPICGAELLSFADSDDLEVTSQFVKPERREERISEMSNSPSRLNDTQTNKRAVDLTESSEEKGAEETGPTEYYADFKKRKSKLIKVLKEVKNKNRFLINAVILTILIIASFFCYAFFKSQDKNAHVNIIAQRIQISPNPKQDTEDTQPKTVQTELTPKADLKDEAFEPEESHPKISQPKEAASASKVVSVKRSSPLRQSKTKPSSSQKYSGYTINIGSFKQKKIAQVFTQEMRAKGYPVVITFSKENKWYRVRVGVFSNLKKAQAYANLLQKKEKLPSFIVKIK